MSQLQHEQRHLEQRHARRAHVHDRHDDVDRAEDRRRRPSGGPRRSANGNASPRLQHSGGYIVQPPAGAPPGQEQRAEQQRERERQDPERQVVQARQRHVRRADLQRDHPVREARRRPA